MIGLTTYELKKRRENISPLRRMEAPGEARFSRLFDFASSHHEESSPPRMKRRPGYFHVSIKNDEDPGGRGQVCYFHWAPTPVLYEIETDEGLSLEDLLVELASCS